MTHAERTEFIQQMFVSRCLPILASKGKDYSVGIAADSANANFGFVSGMIGHPDVTKYTVWTVYFVKHFTSLMTWMRTGELISEPIDGRIEDMINYLFILQSMIEEDRITT